MIEQADGRSSDGRNRKGNHHQTLKKRKVRFERRRCKDSLRRGEEPVATFGKYKDYEL